MDDLSRIRELEKEFGFPLNRVELGNLFTEKPFPALYDTGVRNYSVDENNFVTGLAIDYCPMFFLPDNYLAGFSRLQQLKLRKTPLQSYTFLKELTSLTWLDLSSNNIGNASFLEELTSLTWLDLSNNNITDISFLQELNSLTHLNLDNNNIGNASFLEELTSLTWLDLSNNKLDNLSFLYELTLLTSLFLGSSSINDVSFLKKLKHLTTLDLSNTNLSDYYFLEQATTLQSLDLSNNGKRFYSFVRELPLLTSLNLSSNELSDVWFLQKMTQINSLDLSNNNLIDISFLRNLPSLSALKLTGNNLSSYSFLSELRSLIALYLSGYNISDLSFLKELTFLTSLDLRVSNLMDVSFLKEMRQLTSLILNLYISDLSFLKELNFLTTLNLSNSKISDLSFLKDLEFLTSLNLSGNNLKDASIVKELKELTALDLSDNDLKDASFLKEMKHLAAINLNKNSINNPPKQIVDNGLDAIRSYYRQLEEEGKDYIYEAKMLIVGEPGAGKSTLFEKMKNPNYLPQNASDTEKQSTIGVRINTLSFPYGKDANVTFRAHLWDFGGQPIQYILHQYFFTERSLYVLLADDRRQLTNFHYWFEIITTLGKNCPVLVVLNELNHKSVTNFNLDEYQREFRGKVKEIDKREVDFSVNDKRFFELKDDIESKLCSLEHIGQELPKTWVKVREEIQKKSKNKPYIEINEYHELCKKHGVQDKYRNEILRYFHDLGIALNYENDENLEDIVILNPNWIIDALYVVLRNTTVKTKYGRFNKQFVFNLWEQEGYKSKNDHKLLLALMLKGRFEVAYKVNNNLYIVPALLPFESPKYECEKTHLVQVYFQYDFMPPGILSRLIVRLNENIAEQNGVQIVWERGVLLKRDSSSAEVIESQHKKQLTINVSGESFIENKELLTIVRNEIHKIHKEWFENRLSFQENVPCICNECQQSEPIFYTLAELEKRLQKNKETIECRKSYLDLNVRQLLEGVYIEEKGKDMSDAKYKIAENLHIHGGNQQFGMGEKVSQKQYNQTRVAEQKINSMLEKADDAQEQTLKELANQINDVLTARFDKLDRQQQKKAEDLKSSNWKGKIKFFIPFIKDLGIDISAERDITPDEFAGGIRKALYGDEPILLNLLKDPTES